MTSPPVHELPPEWDRAFVRPPRALYHAEPPRSLVELAQFWAMFPTLAAGPRGEGQPVLVLPGFLAADGSTTPLRALLQARGYRAGAWGLGRNIGPTDHVLDGLSDRLVRLYEAYGRVSVVGWSLGGIYARGLAHRHPSLVRQVVTLGSPFRVVGMDNTMLTHAGPAYDALSPRHSPRVWLSDELNHAPPPVPSTAIFSRTDGVVPWRACLEFEGPRAESVEVPSSHCGLGHNVVAVAVVLDRLSQPDGEWRRLVPRGLTRLSRMH